MLLFAIGGPVFAQASLLQQLGGKAANTSQSSSEAAAKGGSTAATSGQQAPTGGSAGQTPASSASAGSGSAQQKAAPLMNGQAFTRLFTQNSVLSWILLIVFLLAGLLLGRGLQFLLTKIAARLRKSQSELRAELFESAGGPANLAFITAGIYAGLARIAMDTPVRVFVDDVITLLIYIAVFWFAYNIISVVEIALKRFTSRTETKLDDMLVPLIRKTLRLFVIIFAVLLIAENVFRQNIGTWLAGLGIAGIAVSLAAQDSLKNLIGSITILFDRPFKLGDRIVFSGYDGPVEEIGFRSVKIRTLTGHLVTVPNSKVVNEAVENIGARPCIRRSMSVTITYDTPREKIERAVQIIRDLLEEEGLREPIHGKIGNDEYPPRVYFSDYNADSLGIMVLYWFFPPNYWDYMDHAQRFNLRLYEEYEKAGIEFAFPTQTLFLAGDPNRSLSVDVNRPPADNDKP